MPELAEVKLMADYVNHYSEQVTYKKVFQNPKSKITDKADDVNRNADTFNIKADTRGKEVRLQFLKLNGDNVFEDNRHLYMGMGMSGGWLFIPHNDLPNYKQNHIKILFTADKGFLIFHDMRNFAKWRWDFNWSDKRSPCPLTEFEDFRMNVFENSVSKRSKLKTKPICEVLLDQSLFNGVGNYIRAEVLYRLDVNPFQPFTELSRQKQNQLLMLCNEIAKAAYLKGGTGWDAVGEMFTHIDSSKDLIQCYSRKDKPNITEVVDKTKRRFWFDKKWEKYSNY